MAATTQAVVGVVSRVWRRSLLGFLLPREPKTRCACNEVADRSSSAAPGTSRSSTPKQKQIKVMRRKATNRFEIETLKNFILEPQ